MATRVQIVLTEDKQIRDRKVPSGTALVLGELAKGIEIGDVGKALQLKQAAAYTIGAARPAEPDEAGEADESADEREPKAKSRSRKKK